MEKTKRSRITGDPDKLVLQWHEKLLIWRKRKGWNQSQAADYYAWSLYQYKLIEYGELPHPEFDVAVDDIRPEEKCLIYRKRSKKTQHQIAKELGVSRSWLRSQETGKVSCKKLIEYWEHVYSKGS